MIDTAVGIVVSRARINRCYTVAIYTKERVLILVVRTAYNPLLDIGLPG